MRVLGARGRNLPAQDKQVLLRPKGLVDVRARAASISRRARSPLIRLRTEEGALGAGVLYPFESLIELFSLSRQATYEDTAGLGVLSWLCQSSTAPSHKRYSITHKRGRGRASRGQVRAHTQQPASCSNRSCP
eukprot:6179540-Pleurochrysis_carterae.AAC.2